MGATGTGRRRSVAWVYYAMIAALALVGTFSTGQMAGLLVAAVAVAYSTYLFRGGRFVLWIW
jgi:hypothetical protein